LSSNGIAKVKMAPLLNNRYRIIDTLGEGGFGKTFLAVDEHTPSKRQCVVKQLSFFSHDPKVQALIKDRFEQEAAILERLGESHDQIPKLFAYFSEANEFYLVQELIEGDTLAIRVRNCGGLLPQHVREILISLLGVLEYVHSSRIIHRDIKPENVIIRKRDERPVLIDFGAVKQITSIAAELSSESKKSIVIGTRGFMPLEQLGGLPVFSSDLYSLGITSICLLTGKWPDRFIDSGNGEIVWRPLVSELDTKLADVIDTSIKMNAQDRFQTAEQMRTALLDSGLPPTIFSSETIVDGASGELMKSAEPPKDLIIPPQHLYLGMESSTGIHLLMRKRDRQTVLFIPNSSRVVRSYLIDKHVVTNDQYAAFLNDPDIKSRVYPRHQDGILTAVTASGEVLVGDASSYWRIRKLGQQSWGITLSGETWKPAAGCERLPATLVTAAGAMLYAHWARYIDIDSNDNLGLPTAEQWTMAAIWDFVEKRFLSFPWGDSWERTKLNSLSYWASRDVLQTDADYPSLLIKARPTEVNAFKVGKSSSGMIDAFGNVWEWVADRNQSRQRMVKGGACTTTKTGFQNGDAIFRQESFAGETIGFRCCWEI
jgi:serine/threonine protein kinase